MSGAVNPWAAANAARRRAQEQMDRAREPVIAYYVVPRELVAEALAARAHWLDLVSEADRRGCRIVRCQKREMARAVVVPPGHAAVYEGAAGVMFVARENW